MTSGMKLLGDCGGSGDPSEPPRIASARLTAMVRARKYLKPFQFLASSQHASGGKGWAAGLSNMSAGAKCKPFGTTAKALIDPHNWPGGDTDEQAHLPRLERDCPAADR